MSRTQRYCPAKLPGTSCASRCHAVACRLDHGLGVIAAQRGPDYLEFGLNAFQTLSNRVSWLA